MIEPTDGPNTGFGSTSSGTGSGAVDAGQTGGNGGSSGSSSTEVAREHASAAKETAKSEAAQVTQQAKEQAASLGREAKERASSLLHDARSEATQHADSQATRAAGGMRDIGRQLRSMADSGEQGQLTGLAAQAADQIEEFAGRLDDQGVAGLVADVQHFARRRPVMFLAAAGVAGFAVGRLLRNADLDAIKPGGSSSDATPQLGSGSRSDTHGPQSIPASSGYTGALDNDVTAGVTVPTGPVLDEPLIGGDTGTFSPTGPSGGQAR